MQIQIQIKILVNLYYLQIFNQSDQANAVLPASKSSVKSLTAKFHFFSAFSSGPGKVTILVLAHNSVKVKTEFIYLKVLGPVRPYFLEDAMVFHQMIQNYALSLSEQRMELQSCSGPETAQGAGNPLFSNSTFMQMISNVLLWTYFSKKFRVLFL